MINKYLLKYLNWSVAFKILKVCYRRKRKYKIKKTQSAKMAIGDKGHNKQKRKNNLPSWNTNNYPSVLNKNNKEILSRLQVLVQNDHVGGS